MTNSIAIKKVFRGLDETRWVFELIFCVAAYFILLHIFSESSRVEMIDHLYTSLFLGTLILAGTVNSWVIRKRFLRPGRFWMFLLLSLINILFWTLFNQVFFEKLIDYILPGYYFISYYEYIDLFKFFFVYVTLITLLDLSWEWFYLQETRHRMILLEKEKVDAELKALTNQVNPHFLFNSLTVLYGLALKNSSQTADAIIKLSDILRYVIYESSIPHVPLRSEIALIRNYIELQRYRMEETTKINFTVEVPDENISISPMLLLPLVENSFKHGAKGDVANTFIDLELHASNNIVTFRIVNNKRNTPSVEKASGGIGLSNIEDRLKLMYGNQYSFSVNETDKIFAVNLKLKIAT